MDEKNQIFEKRIKEKTDKELIVLLCCSQDYQPEFIELVKKELREVRNIQTYNIFFKTKSDEELINYCNNSNKYQDKFIELVKTELQERNVVVDIKSKEKKNSQQNEKIHGWLTFFLVIIGFGGLLTPIIGFLNMSISDYDLGIGLFWSYFGALCESVLYLGIAGLAFYTILSFTNYSPNAVGLGKTYLIIVFTTNLLAFLIGDFEETGFNSFSKILSRLIWQGIMFSYLLFSEQVNSLFPKQKRKMYKRDKIFISAIVTPIIFWFLFCFVIGIYEEIREKKLYNELFINENALSANEYTDGLIIFELPDGLLLEKHKTEEDAVYYTLHNDDISLTIYSVFDDNDTQEYFDKSTENWSDDYFVDFDYTVIDYWHENVNGSSQYVTTWLYHSEPVIAWSFVMIFNKETGKCCIISYFTSVESEHLMELIHSIRFK